MFTGLIEDIGQLNRVEIKGRGGSLTIGCSLPLSEVKIGDSIAVNGACLTVTAISAGAFAVDFSRETAARTAFEHARPGTRVHLERAMRLTDRLDGHLVMGHVDGVGHVQSSVGQSDSWHMVVSCPESISRYLVDKGSVAVHGVSLTVNEVLDGAFEITIVPHTTKRTFLTELPIGTAVNLEADMLAKYVERLLGKSSGAEKTDGVSLATLISSGFGR